VTLITSLGDPRQAARLVRRQLETWDASLLVSLPRQSVALFITTVAIVNVRCWLAEHTELASVRAGGISRTKVSRLRTVAILIFSQFRDPPDWTARNSIFQRHLLHFPRDLEMYTATMTAKESSACQLLLRMAD
jgi:hypothetical protein